MPGQFTLDEIAPGLWVYTCRQCDEQFPYDGTPFAMNDHAGRCVEEAA